MVNFKQQEKFLPNSHFTHYAMLLHIMETIDYATSLCPMY